MPRYRLAFLGFGNVGQALARLLLRKRSQLEEDYKISFSVVGISTRHHGSAIVPKGISLEKALEVMGSQENSSSPSLSVLSKKSLPDDSLEFIRQCEADVLFENTPVNYQTGQPAIDHLQLALELGMHAITANKGPVVHAYRHLTKLADSKDRKFFFESSVMDGAPIFSLFRNALPGARLRSFHGILNSTTNLILGRMESGESFDQAVAYAQSIGIAETDPSGDIDGWDAAVKVAALVTVLMELPLTPDQVDRQGIRSISQADIVEAQQHGYRWKLVCSADREKRGINARVAPEMVPPESPLYRIGGTTSTIQFETDVLGSLSITETDPGPHTTAYGLLADFINAIR
jgi:homoserine dehydrogenase